MSLIRVVRGCLVMVPHTWRETLTGRISFTSPHCSNQAVDLEIIWSAGHNHTDIDCQRTMGPITNTHVTVWSYLTDIPNYFVMHRNGWAE